MTLRIREMHRVLLRFVEGLIKLTCRACHLHEARQCQRNDGISEETHVDSHGFLSMRAELANPDTMSLFTAQKSELLPEASRVQRYDFVLVKLGSVRTMRCMRYCLKTL